MKKIAAIVLSCMMCISLAACGSSDKGRTDTETEIRSGDATENSVTDDSAAETAGVKDGSSFELKAGTVMLNSGYEMPVLGIGMFRLSQSEAENSVYWALRDGYRLIDTAKIYGNEEGVGKGIKRAIDEGLVKREEIFVTTKMWTDDYDDGTEAIEASLRKLNLDYIDARVIIGLS